MFSVRLQHATKRAIDIAVAGLALLLAAPVLGVACLLVRAGLGGPVFFVQERTGKSQRPFRIYKLRTMTDATDAQGRLLADRDRCGRLGQLLRRSSIDELPQLINVLRGEMSLIGPRPLLPRYDPWYADRERLRFAVRPGITGLAQVSGRNSAGWSERLELDARYVSEWSLLLDFQIAVRTVGKVLFGSEVAVLPSEQMLDLDQERGMSRL